MFALDKSVLPMRISIGHQRVFITNIGSKSLPKEAFIRTAKVCSISEWCFTISIEISDDLFQAPCFNPSYTKGEGGQDDPPKVFLDNFGQG